MGFHVYLHVGMKEGEKNVPDFLIIYKRGFAVLLEIHNLLPSAVHEFEVHSLCNKYGYVINSFIFRAVEIVQSWNEKLGHTFLSASFIMDSKLATS